MRRPIRIIAWGNRGRCDDGVALELAQRLSTALPDVVVQEYHQLGPEIACDLDDCSLAIFVDAHVRTDCSDVLVEELRPAEAAALKTHHCPPSELLALAQCLGYGVPPAYLVCVRAYDMDFGEQLSDATAQAMLEAEQAILELVRSHAGGEVRSHA